MLGKTRKIRPGRKRPPAPATTKPNRTAAFINTIADEGTKEEAVKFLQETWNELCQSRDRIRQMRTNAAVARTIPDFHVYAYRHTRSDGKTHVYAYIGRTG